MKTNVFLIFRYWHKHKKQFLQMLISLIIVTVLVLVSVLLTRTELRRTYQTNLYYSGNFSYNFGGVTDEIYTEFENDEYVDSVGRVAICGKMGDENVQYTYGSYMDKSSENLEYLELSVGHFPEKSGEIAVYDCVLESLFSTSDPDEYLGKEITLQAYDFTETEIVDIESVGEKTFTVCGVIESSSVSSLKEYAQDWQGADDSSVMAMPVIYLYSEDCDITESTYYYTLVRAVGDDILDESTKETSNATNAAIDTTTEVTDAFDFYHYWNLGLTVSDYGGIHNAAEIVTNHAETSNATLTSIHSSASMKVITYFSIIAVLLSTISLFGILTTVMHSRMKSLSLLRDIGCSKKRVFGIIALEWVFLLICGTIVGMICGIAIYELILFLQSHFLGLSALRGYTGEWAVRRVTYNPFIMAIICTSITFLLGYLLYFAKFLFGKKHARRPRKPRSFGRIKAKLSGLVFANIMQLLAVALVFSSTLLCYSYYTIDGKGDGFFTSDDLCGDSYYRCASAQMNTDNVDICLYDEGGSTYQLQNENDYGIPADTLTKIENLNGVESVQSFSTDSAFGIWYGIDDEVPRLVRNLIEIVYDETADKNLHATERLFYSPTAVFGNDEAMNFLKEYVQSGEIGAHENGLTTVLYEQEEGVLPRSYPYEIGDTVSTINVDENGEIYESEAVIDAIAVIPLSAAEENPIAYNSFSTGIDEFIFAAPQSVSTLVKSGSENYDSTYLTLTEGTSDKAVAGEIESLLDSSMKVSVKTLSSCNEAFTESRIARYASILFLFVIMAALMLVGYRGLVAMRVQNSRKNSGILRGLGMSQKSWQGSFLKRIFGNTIGGCVVGIAILYGVRQLMAFKYQTALNAVGYPEVVDLISASEEEYAIADNLMNRYLLSYEMWNVPIIKPILFVAAIMLILTAGITFILLHKEKTPCIIGQITENENKE